MYLVGIYTYLHVRSRHLLTQRLEGQACIVTLYLGPPLCLFCIDCSTALTFPPFSSHLTIASVVQAIVGRLLYMSISTTKHHGCNPDTLSCGTGHEDT